MHGLSPPAAALLATQRQANSANTDRCTIKNSIRQQPILPEAWKKVGRGLIKIQMLQRQRDCCVHTLPAHERRHSQADRRAPVTPSLACTLMATGRLTGCTPQWAHRASPRHVRAHSNASWQKGSRHRQCLCANQLPMAVCTVAYSAQHRSAIPPPPGASSTNATPPTPPAAEPPQVSCTFVHLPLPWTTPDSTPNRNDGCAHGHRRLQHTCQTQTPARSCHAARRAGRLRLTQYKTCRRTWLWWHEPSARCPMCTLPAGMWPAPPRWLQGGPSLRRAQATPEASWCGRAAAISCWAPAS